MRSAVKNNPKEPNITHEIALQIIEESENYNIAFPLDHVWIETEIKGIDNTVPGWPAFCKASPCSWAIWMQRTVFNNGEAYYVGQCPICGAVMWVRVE